MLCIELKNDSNSQLLSAVRRQERSSAAVTPSRARALRALIGAQPCCPAPLQQRLTSINGGD